MIVKLLTEHHFEFLSLKEPAEARPSLHLSKCQIVGNHTLAHFISKQFILIDKQHGSIPCKKSLCRLAVSVYFYN